MVKCNGQEAKYQLFHLLIKLFKISLLTILAVCLVTLSVDSRSSIAQAQDAEDEVTSTEMTCCVKQSKKGLIKRCAAGNNPSKACNTKRKWEPFTFALAQAADDETSLVKDYKQVPFYIEFDAAGEQVIATNGNLTFLARCSINDAGFDRVQIIAQSTTDGWFTNASGGSLLSTAEFVILTLDVANPAAATYLSDWDDGSAVAPDGSYIGIDGEMTGLGLNIFGHNCIAVGKLDLITAN